MPSPRRVCTVVVLIRPSHPWPLVLAANRDERLDRAWDPPAAYWPDHPGVIAGRDRTAGGTWMGLNRHGVVAAVLNRQGSLGPAPGKRSRGVLPLLALAHPTAEAAAQAIAGLDAGQWRSFNLVLADAAGAIFVRGLGQGRPQSQRLRPGLHMVTAHDPDDPDSPRVVRHLPRFAAAPPPAPDTGWQPWQDLLADRQGAPAEPSPAEPSPAGQSPPGQSPAEQLPPGQSPAEQSPAEQLNVAPHGGFGTVCSSLLALPSQAPPVWLFAAGPPHRARFEPIRAEPPG